MSPEKRAAAHGDRLWVRRGCASRNSENSATAAHEAISVARLRIGAMNSDRLAIRWRGDALESDPNLVLWHRGDRAHLGNLLRGSEIGPGLG